MLGYNHDLVFSLFLNEIFSRELSQPLPKRLMHGTALMNSRCAGHRKHTLAPWYSSRGTCSSTARELQPSGPASGQLHLSPLGTWAPNPELSTHLSLSHWEWWEYLQRSPGFVFFWKQRWWRDRSAHSSDPTSHLQVPAPHPTAWHLILGFPCHALGYLQQPRLSGHSVLWDELPGPGGVFLPSLLQATKAQTNPVWLALWAQDGSFTYKSLRAQTPTEASPLPACVYFLFVWRKKSNNLEKSLQFAQGVL